MTTPAYAHASACSCTACQRKRLKRCPFCGGVARLTESRAPSYGGVGCTVLLGCGRSRCHVHPQVSVRYYAPGTKRSDHDFSYSSKAFLARADREAGAYERAKKIAWLAAVRLWNKRASTRDCHGERKQ